MAENVLLMVCEDRWYVRGGRQYGCFGSYYFRMLEDSVCVRMFHCARAQTRNDRATVCFILIDLPF